MELVCRSAIPSTDGTETCRGTAVEIVTSVFLQHPLAGAGHLSDHRSNGLVAFNRGAHREAEMRRR
jgi:hypothetical protein